MLMNILILLLLQSITGCIADIKIITDSGPLIGKAVSRAGFQAHRFVKIPYAEPPIGSLRFQKPKPIGKWSATLNATEFGPSCLQNLDPSVAFLLENKDVSEDCLHLNIFTPSIIANKSRAVMVWIHGGGYHEGQATLFDSTIIAAIGDVIVVTINYRLGAFGFFSFGEFKGNYGIWDQIVALRWIKNNIAYFGGDENRITIFGESAGGSSVGILATIPQHTRGLFQRVIMQSGGYNNIFTISDTKHFHWGKLLEEVGCDSSFPLNEIKECLVNKTSHEMYSAQVNWFKLFQFGNIEEDVNMFRTPGPVIDNDLLDRSPEDALRNISSDAYEYYKSLDVIGGVTSGEGSFIKDLVIEFEARLKTKFDIDKGLPKLILEQIIAPDVMKMLNTKHPLVAQAIIDQYGAQDLKQQGRKLAEFVADFLFNVPLKRALDLHADGNTTSKTFQYLFDEISPFSILRDRPSWFVGAAHADDLAYVFGAVKAFPILSTKSQKYLSTEVIKYWTNFAKNGDPNKGMDVSVQWHEFTSTKKYYIQLKAGNIQSKLNLYEDRMKFWFETIPDALEGKYISSGSTHFVWNILCVFCVLFVWSIC